MVDQIPDWASGEAPSGVPDWAKASDSPEGNLPARATPTAVSSAEEMPGPGSALIQGIGAGIGHVAQAPGAIAGHLSSADVPPSPAAAPLEWSDVSSPYSKLLPKVAYGLGESAPTLAGGVAGGLAGSYLGPAGALGGGAAGAGLGAALQSVAPYFRDELQKSPGNPDEAWTRAITRAGSAGAFSALGWALFPAKLAEGPLKQMAFQTFGVQAPIAAAGQASQNVIQGKPVTDDLGQAYATGAVATAIPAAGHALLKRAGAERESVTDKRKTDPILSRLGDPEDAQTPSKGWYNSFDKLYTAAKDDLHPLLNATDYLAEGAELPAGKDPYVLARLTRGSAGKAEHFIDHSTFDPETGKNLGKGLKQVLDPVSNDLEGFRKYMLSRRAIELHGRDIETGIPIDEAKSYVAENTKYNKPFQDWLKYHDDLLSYMVKSGVVGKDGAAAMREANRDYVPFYRLMEDPETLTPGPGGGLKTRNPIKGIRGSERQILDPIESTVKNTYLFVSLADRNMALRALQDLAESSPRGAEIMQKVPPSMRPIEVTAKEVERGIPGIGDNGGPPLDDFTIFRPNAFRPEPDQIAVFNDGKRSVYKTDPYLSSAVNGLDRESLGLLTKIISAPARLLRAGATLSPEFIARNPIRDQFSAFVFSSLGRGYVPFYDFLKGLGSVTIGRMPGLSDVPGLRNIPAYHRFLETQSKPYQDWLKSGGANSALVSIDRNYIENLVQHMKDPTAMGTVKNLVRSPLDLLRAASELMENATRVGENKRMMQRGATLQEAGFASREVTLDFQRIGAKMRAVNAAIAFFNAQAEGVDRAVRSMINQPLRFAATVGAAITTPSVLLWMANKDDPRMKEIPRWEKDLFWIVPTDKWEKVSAQEAARMPQGYARQNADGSWEVNNGNIWRIPKPFELGVMFGSVPERILDAYHNHDPKAFKNVWSSLQQAFLPNFVPQVASPLIEQFANRSLFTGRPLVPQYLENLLPPERATPYTTDTAKLIGRFVAKIPGMDQSSFASPAVLENWVRAWSGGLGRHILDGSDAVLKASGVVPSKIAPTPTNADKALIRAFAVRYPEAGANSIQDFYEEYDKRKQIKDTVKYLRKTGEPDRAADLTRDNVLNTAEGIHKALSTQFKLVRDTNRNPRMSADEKRRFIDMSYLQMIKMAQTGNEVFTKTEDAFKKQRQP